MPGFAVSLVLVAQGFAVSVMLVAQGFAASVVLVAQDLASRCNSFSRLYHILLKMCNNSSIEGLGGSICQLEPERKYLCIDYGS